MAARNGYAQDFDLIDVPGYPRMPMRREAALQLAGACAEFWMETGIRPSILEAGRSIATQQHYWKTMPPGTAAYPGSSNHGWFIAADMGSPLNSYSHPLWAVWDRIARKWGFTNDQGRATKSKTNPRGESWHYVYVGSPQLRATGREMADMANLYDLVSTILQHQDWHRAQSDQLREELTWLRAQVDTEFQKAELGRQMVAEGFTRVDWLRERVDGIVPPTLRMSEAVLAPSVPETPPPAAK